MALNFKPLADKGPISTERFLIWLVNELQGDGLHRIPLQRNVKDMTVREVNRLRHTLVDVLDTIDGAIT
tara:strand:- start:760 stop:966 length:207 start_codon:yes stop_codon:yes gene_type:complete